MKYRPEIDGLRAIAIISVMLFHLFPNTFPSGFIGVDIFFVISGYLIGKIILLESNDASFGFYNFYLRRVLRIFPALLFTLVATLFFGWLFLLPHEFSTLGKHY